MGINDLQRNSYVAAEGGTSNVGEGMAPPGLGLPHQLHTKGTYTILRQATGLKVSGEISETMLFGCNFYY